MVRALRDVGVDPETRFRYPHEFSGGQRQRIAIARAIVLEPTFVMLDEPTSALDMLIQAQIVDLLRDLQKRRNLTYCSSRHDLKVVAALASRIIVMRNGKVMEEGPAADVFANPKSDYTRALFAAAFNLRDRARGRRGAVGHLRGSAPCRQPAHAGHVAAARRDAGDGLAERLDGDRHVVAIGVHERCASSRTIADMALPEHQVAAPQVGMPGIPATAVPSACFLHVAVARAGDAAGRQRQLHQAGAVEAEAGLAAPQIGRADEALGDGDEIGGDVVDGREMLRRHVAAAGRHRETRLVADDGETRPERQGASAAAA